MRVSVIVSLAVLSLAFPNAELLANPFALNGRSVGGNCDHNVGIYRLARIMPLKFPRE